MSTECEVRDVSHTAHIGDPVRSLVAHNHIARVCDRGVKGSSFIVPIFHTLGLSPVRPTGESAIGHLCTPDESQVGIDGAELQGAILVDKP